MRVDIRSKSFGTRRVLANVSFEAEPGSVIAVTGPSGVGKTTLLRIIAGLDPAYEGSIEIPEPIAMVFQEPRLLPWRTVQQNVRLALPSGVAPAEADERTARALGSVGLASEAGTFPRALSLDMARRVAFARAAVVAPALLLLDEPFVSLDEATAAQLRGLAKSLWRDRSMIVVLVTHNLDEALDLADRFVVLGGSPATNVLDLRMPADYALRDAAWREKHKRLLVDGMAGRLTGER